MKLIKLLGGYTIDDINEIIVEKDQEQSLALAKMQGKIQDYFKDVLELPCPDFRYSPQDKEE